MQQTHAKRKVGGKYNRIFERRSRNRQPHTAASSFRLCGFHRKNHKETIPAHKIWISSIAQSIFADPRHCPRSRSWHLGRHQPAGGLRK